MASANIATSGNILSDDFIELLREAEWTHAALRADAFAPPGGQPPKSVDEDIAAAYDLLRDRWEEIRTEIGGYDVSRLRSRWVIPLLSVLDFEPTYLRQSIRVGAGDRAPTFNLSHRGWRGDGAPIVHSVAWGESFDERTSRKRGAHSPHQMLQRYLNLADDQWGIVTNGRQLRILRDFHHSLTKGYVEIDLEGIFESGDIGDFRALYRLAHASRFVSDDEGVCPLEKFHKSSHEVGVEVGKQLRTQVREAIEILANGFLDGPLIAELQADPDRCRAYYREVLHLIYRMLFLFFAEQKGWLPMRDSLYVESYSLSGLQERASDPSVARDEHLDLWEGLLITFRLVRDGFTFGGVVVPAYGGQLFDDSKHFATLASRTLRNCDLLAAVHRLSYFPRRKVLHKINYTHLQVDALGSVYESLLDYMPRVLAEPEEIDGQPRRAGEFVLDPRGAARKTTGSYYTDRRLVAELIDSALRPVIADRLDGAKSVAEQEQAILSIKVCDPACGSGAFLTAAMDALGEELAEVRCGDEQPSDQDLRRARRDVLEHCIYGVDLNDMAVELCKVSLWIAAAMPNLPLNFLDHRIKRGNSLIGATPALIDAGVPDDAWKPVTGVDKHAAAVLRKRNREERRTGQRGLFEVVQVIEDEEDLELYRRLNAMVEDTADAVAEKEVLYARWHSHSGKALPHRLADLWTAAFFWPMEKNLYLAPTHGVLRQVAQGGQLDPRIVTIVARLAQEHHFFHWHLEFPGVFDPEGKGGFDCVLGNPPWERVKLQEKEFFAPREPRIADARNAAQRKRMIAQLQETKPKLYAAFQAELRESEGAALFLRSSGRFPLTGHGDVNTYMVFSGLARALIADRGRAGIIVPAGIATDYTNQAFFSDLVATGSLASFLDFENRDQLFPGVHRNYNFALMTMAGKAIQNESIDFVFFASQVEHLREAERHFCLTSDDIELLNPNTQTCPVFASRRDAELTIGIYRTCPVLIDERAGSDANPWQVSFFTMFHMANDSHLFRTRADLAGEDYALDGDGNFCKGGSRYLRLYEAKMMHQFEHRHGTYEGQSEDQIRKGLCREPTPEELADPDYRVLPRYWVAEEAVVEAVGDRNGGRRWFIGFRDVTRAVDYRTASFVVLSWSGIGHKIPLLIPTIDEPSRVCVLLACLNSFALDYVARQKIGGISMSYFILKQLPVLPPGRYDEPSPGGKPWAQVIAPKVVELVYTGSDLAAFAADCGYNGSPFRWDAERRPQLRAELDAIYFHLYGISREDAAYILDTFPIVRRRDEEKYGEYRTKRMILEEYDRYAGQLISPDHD